MLTFADCAAEARAMAIKEAGLSARLTPLMSTAYPARHAPGKLRELASAPYTFNGQQMVPPRFSEHVYVMLDALEARQDHPLRPREVANVSKRHRRILKKMEIIKVEGNTRAAVVTIGPRAEAALKAPAEC